MHISAPLTDFVPECSQPLPFPLDYPSPLPTPLSFDLLYTTTLESDALLTSVTGVTEPTMVTIFKIDTDCPYTKLGSVDNTRLYAYHPDDSLEETPVSQFVCSAQTSGLLYTTPDDKAHRAWVKNLLSRDDPGILGNEFDTTSFQTVDNVSMTCSSTITASYVFSYDRAPCFDTNPQIALSSNAWCYSFLPSSLQMKTLIDTGATKTLIDAKFITAHSASFQNFERGPLLNCRPLITATGSPISPTEYIKLPLIIDGHCFEFIALITEMNNDYDFIIGLESCSQLEATFYVSSNTLDCHNRSVPLFPKKEIIIPSQAASVIYLTGALPLSFSSGNAIVRVVPLQDDFSFVTVSTQFIDGQCSFKVTNTTDRQVVFPSDVPMGYLDLRSIGFFNPSDTTQFVQSTPPTTFIDSVPSFHHTRLISNTPPELPILPSKEDPYPWLLPDDPRRDMTDRQILEKFIDLTEAALDSDEKYAFLNVLEDLKEAFSLRDEIGAAPDIEVDVELTDNTPFMIRPFSVRRVLNLLLTLI